MSGEPPRLRLAPVTTNAGSAGRAARDAYARKRLLRGMRYRGLLPRHTRHTAARNLIDAGLDRDRARAITGHLTDSVFSRYNIGREKDVEAARKALEKFHRKRK